MEYAQNINNGDFIRYVGYTESTPGIKNLFSDATLNLISYKITQLLEGVDPEGHPIVVPKSTISGVIDNIYQSQKPAVGDIFTRYIVPTKNGCEDMIQNIINQTIEVIVSDVRNTIGMDEHNKSLSIWTTVLGDFNEHQLRGHAPIKIREKNTNHRGMVGFMNY